MLLWHCKGGKWPKCSEEHSQTISAIDFVKVEFNLILAFIELSLKPSSATLASVKLPGQLSYGCKITKCLQPLH